MTSTENGNPSEQGVVDTRILPDGIGEALRGARRSKGLTGREMARRVGVSPSFVSHIEAGRQKPSAQTLSGMLRVLELSFTDLLAMHTPDIDSAMRQPLDVLNALTAISSHGRPNVTMVQRATERGVLQFPAGMRYSMLTAQRDPEIDFFEVELQPGDSTDPNGKPHSHPGQEFGLVVSGELHLLVGEEEFRLTDGDSVTYNSEIPHSWTNDSEQVTRLIWVCHNTSSGRRG